VAGETVTLGMSGFSNDGSFMAMMLKMQEDEKAKKEVEVVEEVSLFGSRICVSPESPRR